MMIKRYLLLFLVVGSYSFHTFSFSGRPYAVYTKKAVLEENIEKAKNHEEYITAIAAYNNFAGKWGYKEIMPTKKFSS